MRDDPDQIAKLRTSPDEVLWLLGQPHLSDYLDFVKHNVVGGAAMCPRLLTDEWRAANDLYYDLEEQEAGTADTIERLPIDPALQPLVDQVVASPHYRNTFDTMPMAIEMVELDKLIVSQTHVTASFAERRAAKLGRKPSAEALFRYCQPLERDLPPVRVEKSDEDKWIISSESTDLRPQAPLLVPAHVLEPQSSGPIAAAVALIVGFGSNLLTAIRSDDRLVLHNGYHRAYSLRSLGITHAPCFVETVTRKDELRVAATEKVSDDPEFYFRAKRPPLLKDFFDPRLARRHPVRPRRAVVQLEFTLRKSYFVEAELP